MAMAELRDWQHDDDRAEIVARLRAAEEQRVQAEGRCFAAERRRLNAERRLAEVQALLEEARAAGERTREIVVELIALAAQLRASIDSQPSTVTATAPCSEQAAAERAQMADSLAAAVERLRARVAEVKAGEPEPVATAEPVAEAEHVRQQPVVPAAAPEAAVRLPHKHSMSAIARWRNKRKQRKSV